MAFSIAAKTLLGRLTKGGGAVLSTQTYTGLLNVHKNVNNLVFLLPWWAIETLLFLLLVQEEEKRQHYWILGKRLGKR